MEYPLTEDFIKGFESQIEKDEGKPISPNRHKHAVIVSQLINEAYTSGYCAGLQATTKGAANNE